MAARKIKHLVMYITLHKCSTPQESRVYVGAIFPHFNSGILTKHAFFPSSVSLCNISMSANGCEKKMVADNPRRTDMPDNTFSIFETFNFMVFTPEIHILDYSLIIAKLLLISIISCEERVSKRRRVEAFSEASCLATISRLSLELRIAERSIILHVHI